MADIESRVGILEGLAADTRVSLARIEEIVKTLATAQALEKVRSDLGTPLAEMKGRLDALPTIAIIVSIAGVSALGVVRFLGH